MSATGRNLEGKERHALDFYETPGWVTRALFTQFRFFTPLSVLDAGAGTGSILRECMKAWPDAFHHGIEIDVDRARAANEYEAYPDVDAEVFCGSFFDIAGPGDGPQGALSTWDLVISNPPYAKAEEFVRHALTIGRTCAFLLRLNWLASKSRAQFHRNHPSDVFVLPKRPSFTGDGKTDATEYAWFVWGPTDVEECPNGGFRGNRWRILDVKP